MGFGASIVGIPAFLLYSISGTALLALFAVAYVNFTRHAEVQLIRQGNAAAAIGFGGSLIGFSIPLSRAIQQASSIPDLLVWAVMATLVQFGVYLVVQKLILPDVSARIEQGELSAAVTLGAASIAGGMINSAAMTL